MTPDGARDVLHTRAAQAGLAGVHPHRFRRTSAHRWLTGGGQERDLSMPAGWRSDDMPSRYAASTAVERAHEAHRRLGRGVIASGERCRSTRLPNWRRGP
ncbi:hypothetical protein ACI8AA_12120 [Geodermatophilus sp. SYSU D01180]